MNLPRVLYIAAAVCLLAALGCTNDSGFRLEGKITFDGEPIPAGEIVLVPDTSQGNHGPGTMAKIENGWYETTSGKGHVGGPHLLTIHAFDGKTDMQKMLPHGEVLFRDRLIKIDLPKESSEIDLDIPKTEGS